MIEVQDYPWAPLKSRDACCVPVPHLEIAGLSVHYGGKTALRDATLPIYHGCITSIIGPSGCGKTSLLIALNRLTDMIEGCRVEGRILLQGQNVRDPKLKVEALRRRIGMIFQKPNPFPLSIWKNLEFPLKEHGFKSRQQQTRIIEQALHDVGLWDEVKDRLFTPALALSGGQQQRLCIARALCLKPEILLMDEPCSALDPISSATIENLIAGLRRKYTVVIVTHNLAQARRISDYASFFWLRDGSGSLVEFGPVKQIFATPSQDLTAAYVGGARG